MKSLAQATAAGGRGALESQAARRSSPSLRGGASPVQSQQAFVTLNPQVVQSSQKVTRQRDT